jgi:hypothetical protein
VQNKTCPRCNERKQRRLYTLARGLQWENRRKRSKKLGRRETGWEKKIQRQGGKCKGEETDGMDRENGWEVLNGNKQGDEEGEWTYVGNRGETVIDYGIELERVEEFRNLEIALS